MAQIRKLHRELLIFMLAQGTRFTITRVLRSHRSILAILPLAQSAFQSPARWHPNTTGSANSFCTFLLALTLAQAGLRTYQYRFQLPIHLQHHVYLCLHHYHLRSCCQCGGICDLGLRTSAHSGLLGRPMLILFSCKSLFDDYELPTMHRDS